MSKVNDSLVLNKNVLTTIEVYELVPDIKYMCRIYGRD